MANDANYFALAEATRTVLEQAPDAKVVFSDV
jgi:hypothetical protein